MNKTPIIPRISTPVVDAISSLDFSGDRVPHLWYKYVRLKNGEVDALGILILADICGWYRIRTIKDEATGEVVARKKLFDADKLQLSYAAIANKFGIEKRQAMDAIHRLKEMRLLSTELRTVTMKDGTKLGNVLYLEPIPKKIEEITSGTIPIPVFQKKKTKKNDSLEPPPITSEGNSPLLPQKVIAITSEGNTYTLNTTLDTTHASHEGTRSASGEAPRAAARPARAARPAWTGPTLRFRDTFEISSRMRRAGQEPPDYTSGRVYDYEGTDVMVTMDGMSESDLRAYLGLSPIDSPIRPPKETRSLNAGTPVFAAQPLLDVAPEPRPEPASEPKAKKGDPNQKHGACIAYHEIVRLRPNAAQAAEIVTTVTNVERWKEVVKYWQLKGNKPNAVNGMLDCYRKGFVDPFAPDTIRAPGVEAKAQPQAPPPPKAKPAEIFPSWEQVEAWLTKALAKPKTGPGVRLLAAPQAWADTGKIIYEEIKHLPEPEWLRAAITIYERLKRSRK